MTSPVGKNPLNVKISASIMCADLCNLERSIKELEASGVDYLHFDIMDAHFVPNMPLGLEMIRRLKRISSIPIDTHLLVDNNEFFVDTLRDCNVEQISVHAESTTDLDRLLVSIHEYGIKAGVALNPATSLNVLDYVLEHLDFILLMTVNPGFAGKPLVKSAFRKIVDCSSYLKRNGVAIPIEVDGNVSFENIPLMVEAGARTLVCGSSSLFSKCGSITDNVKQIRELTHTGGSVRYSV